MDCQLVAGQAHHRTQEEIAVSLACRSAADVRRQALAGAQHPTCLRCH